MGGGRIKRWRRFRMTPWREAFIWSSIWRIQHFLQTPRDSNPELPPKPRWETTIRVSNYASFTLTHHTISIHPALIAAGERTCGETFPHFHDSRGKTLFSIINFHHQRNVIALSDALSWPLVPIIRHEFLVSRCSDEAWKIRFLWCEKIELLRQMWVKLCCCKCPPGGLNYCALDSVSCWCEPTYAMATLSPKVSEGNNNFHSVSFRLSATATCVGAKKLFFNLVPY